MSNSKFIHNGFNSTPYGAFFMRQMTYYITDAKLHDVVDIISLGDYFVIIVLAVPLNMKMKILKLETNK